MRASRYMLSLAVLAVGAFASIPARAEAQAGAVDWTNHTIKCKGNGSPPANAANISQARLMAERAAKLDAMRNVIETLKGVSVNGAKTAADAMEDPGVKSTVQGVIRNF